MPSPAISPDMPPPGTSRGPVWFSLLPPAAISFLKRSTLDRGGAGGTGAAARRFPTPRGLSHAVSRAEM